MATIGPGTRWETLGHATRTTSEKAATATVGMDAVVRLAARAAHFPANVSGTAPIFRPSRSLT